MVRVGRLEMGIFKSMLSARNQTKLRDFIFIKFQKGQNKRRSGFPVSRHPSGVDGPRGNFREFPKPEVTIAWGYVFSKIHRA